MERMERMIKVKTTGNLEKKYSDVLLKMENNLIKFTDIHTCNYLVVGLESDLDIFADVIFRKDKDKPEIYTDNQFDNLLRENYPEYYL